MGLLGNTVGFPGFQKESRDTYLLGTQDSVTRNLAVPIPGERLLGESLPNDDILSPCQPTSVSAALCRGAFPLGSGCSSGRSLQTICCREVIKGDAVMAEAPGDKGTMRKDSVCMG